MPGFATAYDVEDVLALAERCQFLILAAEDDKWSRGADDIRRNLHTRGCDHVDVQVRPGGHDLPRDAREIAYRFLEDELLQDVE